MKLGIISYSTNTGLGNQTYNLYKYLKPFKTMVVDLSSLNGVETHHERYPDGIIVNGIPKNKDIDNFLEGLDAVFVCETPLNYYLFERARELGIKTILQPNWEFFDYNQRDLPKPDLFLAPSSWHLSEYPENTIYMNVPVDRSLLPKRRIKKFRNFLHPAGRPAIHDRNGTRETAFAFHNLPFKDITLTITTQDKKLAEEYREIFKEDKRIRIDDTNYENYTDLYKGFDCVIIPRKYGGLCLPMQEALGCGLPVIMTDVSPNNEVLPKDWLVKAEKVDEFMTRSMIDIYKADESDLTKKLVAFIMTPPEQVKLNNKVAHSLGNFLDWKNRKKDYLDVINSLIIEQNK